MNFIKIFTLLDKSKAEEEEEEEEQKKLIKYLY